DLLLLGGGLLGVAAHLVGELGDALAQLGFLTRLRLSSQLEQLALAGDDAADVALPDGLHQQVLREFDRGPAVALGFEPAAARGELGQTLVDHGDIALRGGLGEQNEQVARLHVRAVANLELADDAAGRMLYLLDVGLHHQRSGCDDGAGELGGGADHADAADQEDRRRRDGREVGPDRALRRTGAHDRALVPRALAVCAEAGAATGRSACCGCGARGPTARGRLWWSTRM